MLISPAVPQYMYALINKEINGFFNSLIGYIVIIIFLLTLSLFLWIFPDVDFNILNSGYATLDSLFTIVPWVYLFLIPAITMRSIAEEKKSGTLELLLTKPMTEMKIVTAKFIACTLIVLLSLIPTLIYYATIVYLGSQTGSIDHGATWGSYIGLLLLGGVFVAIGIFASSLTDNQVVAFIIALFLCLFSLIGFEKLELLGLPASLNAVVNYLGINAHYVSLSRGVIDSRDIIYFASAIFLFLVMSKTVIESRKW